MTEWLSLPILSLTHYIEKKSEKTQAQETWTTASHIMVKLVKPSEKKILKSPENKTYFLHRNNDKDDRAFLGENNTN